MVILWSSTSSSFFKLSKFCPIQLRNRQFLLFYVFLELLEIFSKCKFANTNKYKFIFLSFFPSLFSSPPYWPLHFFALYPSFSFSLFLSLSLARLFIAHIFSSLSVSVALTQTLFISHSLLIVFFILFLSFSLFYAYFQIFKYQMQIQKCWCLSVFIIILIMDGKSEHLAHTLRKIGLFGEK